MNECLTVPEAELSRFYARLPISSVLALPLAVAVRLAEFASMVDLLPEAFLA